MRLRIAFDASYSSIKYVLQIERPGLFRSRWEIIDNFESEDKARTRATEMLIAAKRFPIYLDDPA